MEGAERERVGRLKRSGGSWYAAEPGRSSATDLGQRPLQASRLWWLLCIGVGPGLRGGLRSENGAAMLLGCDPLKTPPNEGSEDSLYSGGALRASFSCLPKVAEGSQTPEHSAPYGPDRLP